MLRLAQVVRLLTLTAGVLGLVGFYLMYRPESGADWVAAAFDFIGRAVGHPVALVLAAAALAVDAGQRHLDRTRPTSRRSAAYALDMGGAPDARGRQGREALRRHLEGLLRGRGDIVSFVDGLLAGAIRLRASDIHIQPRSGWTRFALRVEGELVEILTAAEHHHATIVRRIKVLSRLVPYQTDTSQDGRLALGTLDGEVDVRVSILPTQHGENVVLRLVRPGAGLLRLDQLGMDPELHQGFAELLVEPQGLVIFTGPTGSGKTTTIYSALSHVHDHRGAEVNIATIEDPVEIDLPFLNQTQVDRAAHLDFAAGLRGILRQDPNVLMIGEIRDAETARAAVQAGLTGHLVLASLHSDSTAGVFARLIELGVEPFLVASASLAALSQRLAPRLCTECLRPDVPDGSRAARLAEIDAAFREARFQRSEGCAACDGSGVRGRTAVFEMLRMTSELRRLIAAGTTTQDIYEKAVAVGMKPLAVAAVEAAAAGRIRVDEALRITG